MDFNKKLEDSVNTLLSKDYEVTIKSRIIDGKIEVTTTSNYKDPCAAVVLMIEALSTALGGKAEDILNAAFNPSAEQVEKLFGKEVKPYRVEEVPDGLMLTIDRDKVTDENVDDIINEISDFLK